MQQPVSARISYEEFERLDAAADDRRLEYFDGVVVAQAEPSRQHESIVSNLTLALGRAVRDRGCRSMTRGSVWSAARRSELKPDWIVICDKRDLEGDGPERTRSRYRFPRLVAEVLSPSNSGAEMHAKLTAYEATASIESYLVIDSQRRQVWHYRREGLRLIGSQVDLVAETPFGSITLDQIYEESGVPALED